MSIIPGNIPPELIELQRWILWRYESRDGKVTKAPYTFMGYRASVTNPEHWTTFECALKFAARPGFAAGVGFVFADTDCFCGIDLDDVWQSDADEGAPWAMEILERFADSYQEVSPSDNGTKIWVRAKTPRCGRWPIGAGAIELYDRNRFFTVTGRHTGILAVTDHQHDVELLVANLERRQHPLTQTRTIPDTIPQGQRHNTLVSLAGSMWRRGMTPEAIMAALLVTDQRQCDPPHGPEHIHKIVESMQRWPR
jgi:primase-polymerase (primpol)-like protein